VHRFRWPPRRFSAYRSADALHRTIRMARRLRLSRGRGALFASAVETITRTTIREAVLGLQWPERGTSRRRAKRRTLHGNETRCLPGGRRIRSPPWRRNPCSSAVTSGPASLASGVFEHAARCVTSQAASTAPTREKMRSCDADRRDLQVRSFVVRPVSKKTMGRVCRSVAGSAR
jgi:hypothetical protein